MLLFILTFLGVYLILGSLYGMYLKYGASEMYYPDFITHQVAVQSEWLVDQFGVPVNIEPHAEEASMKLYVDGFFVARIVEGCNGVSVIILFAAFVLAFFQGWVRTLLFLGVGSLSIYLINILRIAILSIGLFKYPEYKDMLHDIVFPGVIYGLVVLLWLIWIRQFSTSKS